MIKGLNQLPIKIKREMINKLSIGLNAHFINETMRNVGVNVVLTR